MELGPILRTLLRNKTRIALIGIEVALTLAIVVNCISMMLDMKGRMDAETGMDEPNIIRVVSQPFSEDFKEEGYLDVLARLADTIAAAPDGPTEG